MPHAPRLAALLPLLAVAACAAPTPTDPVAATPVFTAAKLAERVPARGRGLRVAAPPAPGCGLAALDNPVMAQWLIAATFAEGPRRVELPVFGCAPAFHAL
jgi:hypothetical protein